MMDTKKIYWRPRGISRAVLLLITIEAIVGLFAVESFLMKREQPFYKQKISAARLAAKAMDAVRIERSKRNIPIDWEVDPAGSGLIGELMSNVTSNSGKLAAKQTSVNPNFAAVIVSMLKTAKVKEGDTVAVAFSGSFPAMNICVEAALQTLKVKPIIISSAAASQWGANEPELLWIDMEKTLYDKKLFSFRSSAGSLGGIEDRGLGISADGRKMLMKGLERNELSLLVPKDFNDSIEQRIQFYRDAAGDNPIKAYISVGGGTSSVGRRAGKKLFKPGLNFKEPFSAKHRDSVMTRFVQQEVPVIHMVKIEVLARQYGLPLQPAKMPAAGEGEIFYRQEYNPWLCSVVLMTIIASLFGFVRMDWGYRILPTSFFRKKSTEYSEPMI
jgi:poly-gamma-glutamate system protein